MKNHIRTRDLGADHPPEGNLKVHRSVEDERFDFGHARLVRTHRGNPGRITQASRRMP